MKKIFLSITLLSGLNSNTLLPGTMPHMQAAPTQQGMPAPGVPAPGAPGKGIPSVSDVFGNMSEDEIIKQVQEAQKFFESLSPEEMAELEKMVSQTLDTMTPQDLEDIQGIAKMVEPHIEVPKESDKKDKKLEEIKKDDSKKKEKTSDIDTDDIKKLIANIDSQVDEVFQKAESSKDAAEEIKNKWSSKVTFDNMRRQISALKEDRLLKKLSKSEHKEDKDLVDKIKVFHKDLTKHNDAYKIEDTFGVPASRSIEAKNLKKTQEILAMFENHIDEVMPPMEKFLRKHDPEALEMAKESAERSKKASLHEKDTEIRRASLPSTPPMSGGNYPSHTPSHSSLGGSMGYDPYGYPGAYDNYGYPTTGQQYEQPSATSRKKPSDMPSAAPGKKEQNKKDEPKQAKKDDGKNTTLNQIINLLEGHKEDYNDKYVDKFKNFLTKDVTAYPTLPTNAQEHHDWLQSKGSYKDSGFATYSKKMLDTAAIYQEELHDMKDMLDEVIGKIPNMDPEQTSSLTNHSAFNHIKNRVEKYKDHYEKTAQQLADTFESNQKLFPGASYEDAHKAFVNQLEHKVMDHIANLINKVEKVKKRARHHRRSRAGQYAQEALRA